MQKFIFMGHTAKARLVLKVILMWLLLFPQFKTIGWMFQQRFGCLLRKSII